MSDTNAKQTPLWEQARRFLKAGTPWVAVPGAFLEDVAKITAPQEPARTVTQDYAAQLGLEQLMKRHTADCAIFPRAFDQKTGQCNCGAENLQGDTAHHVADGNLVGDGTGVGMESLPPVGEN